jgi:hypothetical protein
MNTVVTHRNTTASLSAIDDPILRDETLWQVVSTGDLKGLTPKQKSDYYLHKCRSLGVNPAQQPFGYLTFQGREQLYGTKNLADQLRGLHGISFHDISFAHDGDYMTYEGHVRARDGREDYEVATLFVGGLKGQDLANARMKCLTKFKRRATLSICGAGVLDETEVETMAGARAVVVDDVPERQLEHVTAEVVDTDTGEITAQPLNINDDIKRLREYLGWSAQDVIADARRERINLKTEAGLRVMHDRLQMMVDGVEAEGANAIDWEAEQGALMDAEHRVTGDAGNDAHTA